MIGYTITKEIHTGTRAYYAYTDSQGVAKKEFGRVTQAAYGSFTLKFDKVWCGGLMTGDSGLQDSWTFNDASSMRMVTFLAHEFVLDDIVCIISGPYQGASGLLYAYEGDNLMIDIEHNAVPCKANELELVGRKRLI